MPGPEQDDTPQDASCRREAIADMQERLAQFGRLVGQVRAGLPEQHSQALGRIELGIESLAERIAAFGQDGQRHERAGTPAASPDAGGRRRSVECAIGRSADAGLRDGAGRIHKCRAGGKGVQTPATAERGRIGKAACASGARSRARCRSRSGPRSRPGSRVARRTLCRHRRAAATRAGGHQSRQLACRPRPAPRPVRAASRHRAQRHGAGRRSPGAEAHRRTRHRACWARRGHPPTARPPRCDGQSAVRAHADYRGSPAAASRLCGPKRGRPRGADRGRRRARSEPDRRVHAGGGCKPGAHRRARGAAAGLHRRAAPRR